MSLVYRIIYAAHCSGSHHKLAMDALEYLQNEHCELWKNVFLKHSKKFIEGSKAPDKVFKDFSNHVLHVEDNYWGGAPDKAYEWYEKFVSSLKEENWEEAVYNAGVLSHYYTDPIQPLHTAQSEAENNIHRAYEWSISKSYDDLKALGRRTYPNLKVSSENEFDWVERMVKKGAEKARVSYETLVEAYDFDKGVKNPPEGLDDKSRIIISELITYASRGFAHIMDRAFKEAQVNPPEVNLTATTVLSTLQMPIRWVTNKIADQSERKLIEAMYNELQETGKVEENLPEDDRIVRDLYVQEVLEPKKPGSLAEALDKLKAVVKEVKKLDEKASAKQEKSSKSKPPQEKASRVKIYLSHDDDVEKAPSIGKKTADRLNKAGIATVRDLLSADPETIALELKVKYITPALIKEWQDQANLVCKIPHIRGHDAQLLVAVENRTVEQIAEANIDLLLAKVLEYAKSSQGKRIVRSSKLPDFQEVSEWVENAKLSLIKEAA